MLRMRLLRLRLAAVVCGLQGGILWDGRKGCVYVFYLLVRDCNRSASCIIFAGIC